MIVNVHVVIPVYLIYMFVMLAARNAVMMIATGILAYYFSIYSIGNLSLTGEVKPGLPSIKVPKFTLDNGNISYTTSELFSVSTV